MSLIAVIGFIHNINGNIVVSIITHNSVDLKLLVSNKIDKGTGVTGNYFSDGIVPRDVKKV